MPVDPVTGEKLPYPGDAGYQPKKRRPTGPPRAGPDRGRPANRRIQAGGGAQRPPQQSAQVGPPLGGNPAGLGSFGAGGAIPGVGQRGAVNSNSVLPQDRKRSSARNA